MTTSSKVVQRGDIYVKCEPIQTVSKARLLQKVGTLEPADMALVEVALKQTLALF